MKNIILLIVSFAMFMEGVDATIINTAIPAIAKSLQVDPLNLKVALISYLISLAIFIPISGWIADKFGPKKVFIIALILFTFSSFWCGLSNNLIELIIARVFQGLGGSLTLPVGRLIIVRFYERHELITKMSIVVMVASIGLMLGPLLGGFITNHFSWRWIFWVNIPVGFLAIILATYLLPPMFKSEVPPLDKLGFILFGSGLALFTFGMSLLSDTHRTSLPLQAFSIIGMAIILLILYAWHSRNQLYPIVKTDLLQYRTFRISVTGNLLSRLGFGGVPFLVPLLLQLGLGFSPQLSGLLLAPMAIGIFLVKSMSIIFLRQLGYKNLLILNTCIVGILLCLFAFINIHSSNYFIAFLTFIYGFFLALQYTAMNSLAYANLTHQELSAATSIMSTIQQLAQSFGVAVAAILIRYFAGPQSILTISTFHRTFIALGLITLLSVIIFKNLREEDGAELILKNR